MTKFDIHRPMIMKGSRAAAAMMWMLVTSPPIARPVRERRLPRVKYALIVERIDEGSSVRRTRLIGGPPMLVAVPKIPDTDEAKNMLRFVARGDQPTRLKAAPPMTVIASIKDSPALGSSTTAAVPMAIPGTRPRAPHPTSF